MRTVIQRVSRAELKIDGIVHSRIGVGLLLLVGITDSDTEEDIQWLSGKISRLRIFPDKEGLMNLSLIDEDGELLIISQFTLQASTKKGNRPSFIQAARPEIAMPLYEKFIRQMEMDLGKPPQTGVFGADMKIELVNDGPVTLIIDSKNRE